jgi:recombination endonuclease VII
VKRICGRPLITDNTRRCPRVLVDFSLDPEHWLAPACRSHMTFLEEREAEQSRLRDRAARDRWEPACWSWAVPPTVECATDDEADEFLRTWQDGRCAICGYQIWKLDEDHDHVTGLVRGYLCPSCNVREGMDISHDGRFGRYRDKYPALMLGLWISYVNPVTGYQQPLSEIPQPSKNDEIGWLPAESAAVDAVYDLLVPLDAMKRSEALTVLAGWLDVTLTPRRAA